MKSAFLLGLLACGAAFAQDISSGAAPLSSSVATTGVGLIDQPGLLDPVSSFGPAQPERPGGPSAPLFPGSPLMAQAPMQALQPLQPADPQAPTSFAVQVLADASTSAAPVPLVGGVPVVRAVESVQDVSSRLNSLIKSLTVGSPR